MTPAITKRRAFESLLSESVEAMRQSPLVVDAAVGLSVPYERGLNYGFKIMDGNQAGTENGSSLVYVTPSYFSTLRIPLLAGRSFTASDSPSSQPVMIVNQAFGKSFFNDPSPLGRHIQTSNITYTVVGVVADIAKEPGMQQTAPISTEPVFYLPATQTAQGLVNIATSGSSLVGLFAPVTPINRPPLTHATISRQDSSGFTFLGFYSMDQILREQLQQQRIEVLLLTTLAGLALLLSVVGIYALVSNWWCSAPVKSAFASYSVPPPAKPCIVSARRAQSPQSPASP